MSTIVFVDESGDTGITKLRSKDQRGSSPYFVVAAAVMPRAVGIQASTILDEFEAKLPQGKKWRHATDLSHHQMLYLCRILSKLNLRFFGVISNKLTLEDYADRIGSDPHMFYNKCLEYLMEKVCGYLLGKGISETPEVLLEERNHDYDRMRRYFSAVKENPLHTEAKNLRILNPFAMSTRTKDQEKLLRVADAAAHALYQCANKTDGNFFIPEYRYLEELSKRFGADGRGLILGNGLKCIHTLEQLELDKDVETKIKTMRALPMRR